MAEEKDPASAASGAAGDKNPPAKASGAEPTPKSDQGPPPAEPGSQERTTPEATTQQTPGPGAESQQTPGAEPEGQQTASASESGAARASGEGSLEAEPASPEAAPATDADRWAPYDPVLDAIATELRLGVGTCCGEQWTEVEGRFLGWNNRAGWRCLLRLLRPPAEDVVVLVAEGPPLPGGRARVMVLGGFPAELDTQMLRGALELGFAIGETWGPADETPGEPAAPAGASEQTTGNGPGAS